ncbi:uncharacterized protein OCT59_015046 [Rhizophagus irregularis]|uniref:uncharacterized protein n=1 Tax=Rhizophagus irregularis TaxID=588596 RepID=UPI00333300B7|nr:hypothetical protein OCT59_015046 [Rhizophagus irregularis]
MNWGKGISPSDFIGLVSIIDLRISLFGLYWMGRFPLTNWGFFSSDFIGLISFKFFETSVFIIIKETN